MSMTSPFDQGKINDKHVDRTKHEKHCSSDSEPFEHLIDDKNKQDDYHRWVSPIRTNKKGCDKDNMQQAMGSKIVCVECQISFWKRAYLRHDLCRQKIVWIFSQFGSNNRLCKGWQTGCNAKNDCDCCRNLYEPQ